MANIVGGDCRPNGQHLDSDALGGWYRHCKRARRVEPAKQLAGLGAFAQVEAAESAGCAACEHVNLSTPAAHRCRRKEKRRVASRLSFLQVRCAGLCDPKCRGGAFTRPQFQLGSRRCISYRPSCRDSSPQNINRHRLDLGSFLRSRFSASFRRLAGTRYHCPDSCRT